MHTRIRETNDRIQAQLETVSAALRQKKLEREQHFVEQYGPNLGGAATRFSYLSELDATSEAKERMILADEVSAAIEQSPELSENHPINAVIEATELRTQANYVPLERRIWKGVPGHLQVPDSDDEID